MRPLVMLLLLAAATAAAQAPPDLTQEQARGDFDVFWSEVNQTYAFFDGRTTRWHDVPALYEAALARVRTRRDFVEVLEQAIAELYDDHAHLNVNTPHSFRLVPSGSDLWGRWIGPAATITDVRSGTAAEAAGILPGALVISVNGTPIAQALAAVMPRSVAAGDPGARDWALRRVLTGRHGEPRRLEVEQDGRRRLVELPPVNITRDSAPVTSQRLEGGVGYVRFNDSLGDDATIEAFDRALQSLRDTKGLVLDLRDTPSGGNSTIARAILGRFVAAEVPYQKHVLTAEERATGIRRSWIELVSPRGPFRYEKRVAVLVGRWTGSMGEGLAIGFDATRRGATVGGPMAQLLGATYGIDLPATKIGLNIPAERLYHVDGRPREAFVPRVHVAGPPDAVLDAGVRTALGRRVRPTTRCGSQ